MLDTSLMRFILKTQIKKRRWKFPYEGNTSRSAIPSVSDLRAPDIEVRTRYRAKRYMWVALKNDNCNQCKIKLHLIQWIYRLTQCTKTVVKDKHVDSQYLKNTFKHLKYNYKEKQPFSTRGQTTSFKPNQIEKR